MTKILCVGDLHLGRVPGLLPNLCEQTGLTPQSLSPVAAWRRIIAYACTAKPDVVVSTGDIIDKDNRFYEAFGPFEEGLKELEKAGIPVYAVAGNHDASSLPKMTRSLPNFTLIGQGSQWEIVDLPGETACLVGWSFSQSSEPANPFSTFDAIREEVAASHVPVIGLLHCDLDLAVSQYAPVSSQQLRTVGVDAWLLGHIHKPHDFASAQSPLIGYLGSCVGLDPTETGIRGPWMLEIGPGGAISMRQVPLAPLRWEIRELALDGLRSIDDLETTIIEKLTEILQEQGLAQEELKAVGCRLRLTGRTRFRQEILRKLADVDSLYKVQDRLIGFVDKAEGSFLRPDLDLQKLRGNETPLALLASHLWEIENRTETGGQYVQKALPELSKVLSQKNWLSLETPKLTDDEARHILLDSGLDALEALQAQKESL